MEESALGRLGSGATAPAVFLELLAEGVAPTEAAIAVCVAAGSPRADAERRLESFDGIWDLFEAGDEGDAADLLAMHGYFEPDADLTDGEQETAAHLRAVLATVSGIPSGYAVTLFRDLRMGRLAKAFLQLEWFGNVRWMDNKDFWAAMRRAGEMFPDGHSDLDAARRRCYERAAHRREH